MAVMSLFPVIAGAVGTYYNGNLYQNPQQRYTGGYYNSYGAGRAGYGQNVQNQLGTQKLQQKNKKQNQQGRAKQGFVLDAGLTHQMASWEFDMNKAGSKLHYDNLRWNVFDVNGTYYFGDNTKMQIKAGLQYGMQFGDSPMIDDDMSNGGSLSETWYIANTSGGFDVLGYQTSHSLSVGTTKGGNQFGFNAAFGLTDYFTLGKMKVTPLLGFRYFKHKLTTEHNYGVSMDIFESNDSSIVTGIQTQPGEEQWIPFLVVGDGSPIGFAWNGNTLATDYLGNYVIDSPGGRLDVGQSLYYQQSGTSHEYETTWMGPYLALDMEYTINNDNYVTAGIEFGLPIYDSKGTQPYRVDWQQSPSVEDKGGFGDAYHLGLNANWVTAITDSTSLTFGFTYDYYKVSDADAKTHLSPEWYGDYLDIVTYILDNHLYTDENSYLYYVDLENELLNLKSAGWTVEEKNEVNSIYKSMGIRIGISVVF